MATSKAKKSQVLEDVKEILKENQNVVLTEYRGLNVEKMTELRSILRKSDMKFKVLKNTLTRKIFQEAGIENFVEHVQGPVALAFLSQDPAVSTKTLLDFAKKNELFIVKAGYVDGKIDQRTYGQTHILTGIRQ